MRDIRNDDLLKHVKLAIRTPKGTWPTEGFLEVPVRRDILEQLDRAVEALGIGADTDSWNVTSEGRSVDARATFVENGLTGEVIIRFGPPGHVVHRGG